MEIGKRVSLPSCLLQCVPAEKTAASSGESEEKKERERKGEGERERGKEKERASERAPPFFDV